MPQVKTWKHPRKKQYTENKYIHINRLKTDAHKNFRKKRLEQLTQDLKDSYAELRPLRSLADYVQFLELNKTTVSKIISLENNGHLYSVKPVCPVRDFLISLHGFRIMYDGSKISGHYIEVSDNPYFMRFRRREMADMHRRLVDVTHTSYNATFFPHHKNFRFDDVNAFVKETRKKQEEEVIMERLNGNPLLDLPKSADLTKPEIAKLKFQVIESVYEDRPLVASDIGKDVLYINFDTDVGLIVAQLLSYTEEHAIIFIDGILPIQVERNEIKNIF